ncbi:MAG: GSCFA domain-containing protein [Rubellimicrobium sp.]|nr:GSCFA domain-containing protein [Rubellimicrobium sp.]
MSHPYADLPPRAFWKTAVAGADRRRFPGLVAPRFAIGPATRVATAGSCFAQHIARALRAAGCHVLDGEPAPAVMAADVAARWGYGLYSGRYGNIYTARQMRQLLEEIAQGADPDPRLVWERPDGRLVDALRPTVEPEGLGSVDEVLLLRAWHRERVAQVLRRTDVFIFTLGLTEAWEDAQTGRVLPLCPGVVAGTFDPARHLFRNFRTSEVLADLHAIHAALGRFRAGMRMIVTVSPVPLTATASGQHVLTATAWSKAVLRAAAGEFVADVAGADYFPSLELVTQPASGGPWFDANLRTVSRQGVERVMDIFLAAHGLSRLVAPECPDPPPPASDSPATDAQDGDALVCEDLLLQAFSR